MLPSQALLHSPALINTAPPSGLSPSLEVSRRTRDSVTGLILVEVDLPHGSADLSSILGPGDDLPVSFTGYDPHLTVPVRTLALNDDELRVLQVTRSCTSIRPCGEVFE
jgi:hypothetical protein